MQGFTKWCHQKVTYIHLLLTTATEGGSVRPKKQDIPYSSVPHFYSHLLCSNFTHSRIAPSVSKRAWSRLGRLQRDIFRQWVNLDIGADIVFYLRIVVGFLLSQSIRTANSSVMVANATSVKSLLWKLKGRYDQFQEIEKGCQEPEMHSSALNDWMIQIADYWRLGRLQRDIFRHGAHLDLGTDIVFWRSGLLQHGYCFIWGARDPVTGSLHSLHHRESQWCRLRFRACLQ